MSVFCCILFCFFVHLVILPAVPNNQNLDRWDVIQANCFALSQACLQTDGSSPFVQHTLSQYLRTQGRRGQRFQCFTTLGRLKGRSVSVETVWRCQMSQRWVMVTSRRAMGNFHGLERRQREDCLLIKRVIEGECVCVCVCVYIFPQDLDALLSLNSRHL